MKICHYLKKQPPKQRRKTKMKELIKFEMPRIKFIKADSEDIIQTSGLSDGGEDGTVEGGGASIFGFNKKSSNGFYV